MGKNILHARDFSVVCEGRHRKTDKAVKIERFECEKLSKKQQTAVFTTAALRAYSNYNEDDPNTARVIDFFEEKGYYFVVEEISERLKEVAKAAASRRKNTKLKRAVKKLKMIKLMGGDLSKIGSESITNKSTYTSLKDITPIKQLKENMLNTVVEKNEEVKENVSEAKERNKDEIKVSASNRVEILIDDIDDINSVSGEDEISPPVGGRSEMDYVDVNLNGNMLSTVIEKNDEAKENVSEEKERNRDESEVTTSNGVEMPKNDISSVSIESIIGLFAGRRKEMDCSASIDDGDDG